MIINQEDKQILEIENSGTSDLTIEEFKFVGQYTIFFSISNGGNVPITIQPGMKHYVEIKFAPVIAKTQGVNLEISHNGVNDDNLTIIEVAGEAIDIDPQITIDCATAIDFGSVSQIKIIPTIKFITIESTGSDQLKIRDIGLTNNTGFRINIIVDNNNNTRTYPTYLQVGEKLIIELEFAPTAGISYVDKLTIVHNGTNALRPLVIDLKGEGHQLVTQTFQFTGSIQQFTVPSKIHLLKLELWGGSGGGTYPTNPNTDPGKGGYVVGLIYVNPGDNFEIYVGGKGDDGVLGNGGAGGWNGGGYGGTFNGTQQYGGGGGGASDIRFGGNTLYDRIIVAGAGGGASAHMAKCHGGAGGGLEAGHGMLDGYFQSDYCGKGGTQLYGGLGGCVNGITGWGDFGIGGNAYPIGGAAEVCGGGGGAGWWGGGSGSTGGGGGGSSYTDPQKILNVQHQQGIHIGDGKVKITY